MVGGRLGRLLALRRRLTERPSPKTERLLSVLAGVVFLAGGYLAWRGSGVRAEDLVWTPLAITAVLLVPATVALNAVEYWLTGWILGVAIRPMSALRVTVVATAANLLPLPGGALVRMQGLRNAGASYRRSVAVNIVAALFWVGASLLLAGVALFPTRAGLAVLVGSGAVAVVLAGAAALARVSTRPLLRGLLSLSVVELLLVVVQAVRLLFVLWGLGIAADLGQTLVLSASAAMAASAGIFPGGLGLTEAISAALAPIVDLSAGAGFLSTGVNRVVGLVTMAPVAIVAAVRSRTPSGEEQDPAS